MEPDDALQELLGDARTDDEQADLIAAAVEAWRRRHVNTAAGAAVIAELKARGLSWRQIGEVTGIPHQTAFRWARPPEADTGTEETADE